MKVFVDDSHLTNYRFINNDFIVSNRIMIEIQTDVGYIVLDFRLDNYTMFLSFSKTDPEIVFGEIKSQIHSFVKLDAIKNIIFICNEEMAPSQIISGSGKFDDDIFNYSGFVRFLEKLGATEFKVKRRVAYDTDYMITFELSHDNEEGVIENFIISDLFDESISIYLNGIETYFKKLGLRKYSCFADNILERYEVELLYYGFSKSGIPKGSIYPKLSKPII